MDNKIRELLVTPFAKKLVKSRKSAFGKVSYVSGPEYVRRLNEAFEFDWSFEVLEHRIEKDEALVLGKLTAAGISKTAFGGSQVTRTRDGGELVSLVDDFKAAATDSLKKACSLFGIGLELQCSAASRNESGRKESGSPRQPNARQSAGKNGTNGTPDRLTIRQLGAINSLARKAKYSSEDIREKAQSMFGVALEGLTKGEASTIIGDLSDARGDAAAA